MLIRITNQCNMMCAHCMIDGVSPTGEHMTRETFIKALNFAERSGSLILVLSGGEPTLHPQLLKFIQEAGQGQFAAVALTSNGTFLHNKELTAILLDLVKRYKGQFNVQITNDSRFYPETIPTPPLVFRYETHISTIRPCKRLKEQGFKDYNVKGPSCFNLRSATRRWNYLTALMYLEARFSRFCTPSISVDGSVRAGEPDSCHQIGTVDSTPLEITEALRSFKCNKCGLEDGLSAMALEAIGVKRLVTLK